MSIPVGPGVDGRGDPQAAGRVRNGCRAMPFAVYVVPFLARRARGNGASELETLAAVAGLWLLVILRALSGAA